MNREDIGKRLRELRGSRSIAEVSAYTGIGETALRNYENGYRIPRDAAKMSLAHYYGVSVEQLFFATDYTNRVETAHALQTAK